MAGLLTAANPYSVSKHGVVCLTEGLYKEFKSRGTRLSASVLCPGWVNTQIAEAERNRPDEFGPAVDRTSLAPDVQQRATMVRAALKAGFAPEEVATQVLEAVRDDRFYIIPAQPQFIDAVRRRFDELVNLRNPTVVPLV